MTYYVRTTGNNANNGASAELAKLTVDSALSIAGLTGDDIIDIGAGTFTGDGNTDFAGSAGHPIVVRGAGPGVTFIAGNLTVDKAFYTFRDFTIDSFRPFNLTGAGSILIENIASNKPGTAIEFGGASDCTVRDCDFSRWRSNGCINLSGSNNVIEGCVFHNGTEGTDVMRCNGATYCNIRDCEFRDLKTPNNATGTATDTVVTGLGNKTFNTQTGVDWSVGDYFEAEYADDGAHRMTGEIVSYDSETGVLVLDVSSVAGGSGLTYTDWKLHLVNAGNHSDIFQAFGRASNGSEIQSHDNVVERCWVENNSGQFGNFEADNISPPTIRDWTFRNMIFVNSRHQMNVFEGASGFKFHNCVVYNWANDAGFGSDNAVDVYNCIFCRVGSLSFAGAYNGNTPAKDYNFVSMYGTDGQKTGLIYNGTTQLNEQHGINGGYTPYEIFVDPDNGDFRLAAGSPAIGAGTDLSASFTDDYAGATRATWDMGAYAYEEAGPDVTAPTATAAIPAAGTTLVLSLSEACTAGEGGPDGVTLSATGGAVTATYASGSGTHSWTYTLSRTVNADETVTWSYATADGIEDAAGNDLAAVTDGAVTNNSTQGEDPDPDPEPEPEPSDPLRNNHPRLISYVGYGEKRRIGYSGRHS